ncbi:hypothetical protein J421_2708 [Gemmatirosa kalamazoonensis]|uniref:Uncharacterized protein n=1 Tax=Gemmatirosa kalamazoonensis TaxID=861299 RepID=W0RIU6_9BACT|nr:hypothetical protein [Gemmatirosa kalamazoonensis]AHG90245.1 hypothetical protein J421_2708 [Gemmatirosa kalamazoonensis]
MRVGDRLQVLDTITLVKRPTRLAREGEDSVLLMGFVCNQDTARAAAPISLRVGQAPDTSTIPVGNAQPMAVTLTADSTGTLRVAVPDYFVRWEIVSPTSIPTTQYRGVTRPAISIIADLGTDRPTNNDTTSSSGTATAYLRVVPSGLPPSGAFADSIVSVRVRATARTRPDSVVRSPVEFVVRLRRVTSLPTSGALTGTGCGR